MKVDIQTLIEVARKQNVQPCGGRGWRNFTFLRNNLKKEALIEAEWLGDDKWRNTFDGGYSKLPRPDILKESTFDECVQWSFNVHDLVLTVTMWNGDMLDGFPQDERCRWKYQITDEDTTLFEMLLEPVITNQLVRIASEKYEDELERQRKEAIRAIFEGMFK